MSPRIYLKFSLSACYFLSFRIFDSPSPFHPSQSICCLLPLIFILLLRLPFEPQRPRPWVSHPFAPFSSPGETASSSPIMPTLLSGARVLSVPTLLLLPLQHEINFLLYLSPCSPSPMLSPQLSSS